MLEFDVGKEVRRRTHQSEFNKSKIGGALRDRVGVGSRDNGISKSAFGYAEKNSNPNSFVCAVLRAGFRTIQKDPEAKLGVVEKRRLSSFQICRDRADRTCNHFGSRICQTQFLRTQTQIVRNRVSTATALTAIFPTASTAILLRLRSAIAILPGLIFKVAKVRICDLWTRIAYVRLFVRGHGDPVEAVCFGEVGLRTRTWRSRRSPLTADEPEGGGRPFEVPDQPSCHVKVL
ncbi:unnamed protein product [Microthlaspi erraticum]|uniref:Uncharacterized protein n=1 Tax=Microthlaspi erraticum TaxID=1685480 RepID=A0A6D2KUT7_9BRAS|nr:unnamed protein product [Microthlaspi erraticum]